ncbi:hypothetical protein GDO81_025019 [Engystomops pustulosus]|uniref:Uncharacterized protein n=1 Tax=Engystomops pustulosus TaxID=76066 RepID=A0AAV6YTN6_ENGPU|nr:hypothetical protein GDO81_025019 [Engystomops pustulosus]
MTTSHLMYVEMSYLLVFSLHVFLYSSSHLKMKDITGFSVLDIYKSFSSLGRLKREENHLRFPNRLIKLYLEERSGICPGLVSTWTDKTNWLVRNL